MPTRAPKGYRLLRCFGLYLRASLGAFFAQASTSEARTVAAAPISAAAIWSGMVHHLPVFGWSADADRLTRSLKCASRWVSLALPLSVPGFVPAKPSSGIQLWASAGSLSFPRDLGLVLSNWLVAMANIATD